MRALLLLALLLAAAAPRAQSADALAGAWAVVTYAAPDTTGGAADPLGALLPELSVPETPITITLSPDGTAEIWVVVVVPEGFLNAVAEGTWQADGDRLALTLDRLHDARPAVKVAFTVRADGDGWVFAGAGGAFHVVPDPLAPGAGDLQVVPGDE